MAAVVSKLHYWAEVDCRCLDRCEAFRICLIGILPPRSGAHRFVRFLDILRMLAQSPSILITDDDLQFRETLRGVLEPQGYRTLLAGDGVQACEIVAEQEVHLLLLDMHMPRLSGIETLRRVKQLKALLPCIMLSARWDEDMRAEVRRAKAFSLLSKPVTRSDLTEVVQTALERTYGDPGTFGDSASADPFSSDS